MNGAEVKRLLVGDDPVAPELLQPAYAKPLLEWTPEAVWDVFARPGLPLKTRCIVVVTTLAVMNRLDKLVVHMRGALRAGVTPEELGEVILQMTSYAGAVTGADAMGCLAKAVALFEADKAKA